VRRNTLFLSLILCSIALSDCNCGESLGLALGEIELALCDRGETCGCALLTPDQSTIDFGSPDAGQTALRVLTLRNINQPRKLTISEIIITGGDLFAVTNLQKRASDADDAASESHNLAANPLVLEGEELAEVYLSFRPASTGLFESSLTVRSDSPTRSSYTVKLRGGGGDSQICVPLGSCEPGVAVDFGTFEDTLLGPDFNDPRGRPLALGTQLISIKNRGTTELYFTAAITQDGIPEGPDELVGETGVFFLGDVGCATVAPGETGLLPIEYRPSTAGEHTGEVTIKAFGPGRKVPLKGRVIGAHICFRTEDSLPDDAMLTFGDPPDLVTPVNADPPEMRRLWLKNCGYQKDLGIAAVDVTPGSSSDFANPGLPWTRTAPLAPGDEVEMPITLHPTASVGSTVTARYNFHSNDRLRPIASMDLVARIGAPEQCLLIANPGAVDFGWVASDDAQQGVPCPPPPFPCPGGGSAKISRAKDLKLTNVGERPCTNIGLQAIAADSSSNNMFSVETNPNGTTFSLNPGQSSQVITLLFVKPASDTVTMHSAQLPYASPNMPFAPVLIPLQAKAGGSPHCALDFQPVAPPSFMCSLESLAFGNVNIGRTKTMDLRVINVGSETCNVTNIGPTAGTSSAFVFPSTPLSIAVSTSSVIPVSFTPLPPSGNPMDEIPFNCGMNGVQMTANSGAGGANEQHTVAFSGKGKPPSIDVIPGEIDFGEVTVGCCSAERRVAIYNTGALTLTIDSVAVLGGAASAFHIVSPPTRTSITNGQASEFTARFCATSVGAASDSIEIKGHDENANDETYSVAVSGTGVVDNAGDDRFQQPSRPKVDVLWVVDDSTSMSDDQENLANNFSAFIQQATSLNSDYHMGVTNSDGKTEWSGRLHTCNSSRKYITDAQPVSQQQSDFQCNVKTAQLADARPHTDDKESPLQAGRAAFEYPNLDGWNAGFYREDAGLYVLIVSDEVDQSDGSAQLYIDYFQNLKGIGNPDLLDISAISGPPPDGCETAEGNQPAYDVVTAVSGQFRSICTADWTDLVSTLGIDVFHARRQFPLSRPATASTIAVRYCSGACPANPATDPSCTNVPAGATQGFTFDAALNSVTLHGTPAPQAGSCVAVTYLAVCYQ
jgi:hypothetical protein